MQMTRKHIVKFSQNDLFIRELNFSFTEVCSFLKSTHYNEKICKLNVYSSKFFDFQPILQQYIIQVGDNFNKFKEKIGI